MYAPVELVVELLGNVEQLVTIFLEDVVLGVDPLTAIAWLFGLVFITVASLVMGYYAVGTLAKQVGIDLPALGQ